MSVLKEQFASGPDYASPTYFDPLCLDEVNVIQHDVLGPRTSSHTESLMSQQSTPVSPRVQDSQSLLNDPVAERVKHCPRNRIPTRNFLESLNT